MIQFQIEQKVVFFGGFYALTFLTSYTWKVQNYDKIVFLDDFIFYNSDL